MKWFKIAAGVVATAAYIALLWLWTKVVLAITAVITLIIGLIWLIRKAWQERGIITTIWIAIGKLPNVIKMMVAVATIGVVVFILVNTLLILVGYPQVAIAITGLAIGMSPIVALVVWWWSLIALPKHLKALADKNTLVTAVKENGYVFIERSGGFAFLVEKTEGNQPTVWARDNSLIPKTLSNPIGKWLLSRGLIWLGFDSPAITKPGEITIPHTKLKPQSERGDDINKWVTITQAPIKYLQKKFPVYLTVKDVETTDKFQVTYVALAYVEIQNGDTDANRCQNAWKFWYQLGGKGIQAITTECSRAIRLQGQEVSLLSLYDGTAERELEEKLNGTAKPTKTLELAGAEITHLTIEDWDDNSSDEWKKSTRQGQEAELAREGIKAVLQTRKEAAEIRKDVAVTEKEAFDAEKSTAEAEFEAIKKLAGGNDELTMVLILERKLSPEAFTTWLKADMIKHTGLTYYSTGGGGPVVQVPAKDTPSGETAGSKKEKK